jgi:nucleoside-diphosphate-sugar epimerase
VRALVTGGAGFVGSHLTEALVDQGHEVRVVDCLTDYYDPSEKQANLDRLDPAVERVRADLRTDDLAPLVDDIDVVFHQAGQPGVRLSWADGFPAYESCNVLATQRLLEACRGRALQRIVLASSSSVYGDAERYPTLEDDLPRPRSPYGVTKLACEHLCAAYASNWGVPTVALRYFTVYGPRQRPDMAFHRLCESVLTGTPFPLYGDGSQVRDFTFVGDVVSANIAVATGEVDPGTVLNVAGGTSISLGGVIELLEELAGSPVPTERHPVQSGDVQRTGGSTDRIRELLGWFPVTDLRRGLQLQLDWHRARAGTAGRAPAVNG